MKSHSILGNALFEMLIGGVSRVFGMLGLIYAARTFGATDSTDIIYFSTALIFTILGFLTTINGNIILPQFMLLQRDVGKQAAWNMVSSIFTIGSIVVMIGAVAIYLLFRYGLGYISRFEASELEGHYFLALVMAGTLYASYAADYIANIFRGCRNFLIPNAAMALGSMVGLLFLVATSETLGVISIAFSFLISQVAQMLMLLLYLVRNKMHLKFQLQGANNSSQLFNLIPPYLISQIGAAIVLLYPNYLLTGLDGGALTAITYARRIFELVPAMLIMPMVSALTPSFSDLLKNEQASLVVRRLGQISAFLYALLIPLSVFVFLYANLIVAVAFEGRNFSLGDQGLTADALRWYFAALLVLGSNAVVTKAIVMTQNVRLAYISLTFAIAPAIGVPLFTKIGVDLGGAVGVAAAYAIYLLLIHQSIGYFALEGIFGGFALKREIISIVRPILYAVISGVVTEVLLKIISASGFLELAFVSGVYALIYVIMHAINKTDEFQTVSSIITGGKYAS